VVEVEVHRSMVGEVVEVGMLRQQQLPLARTELQMMQ
jgi:hypothetical protein